LARFHLSPWPDPGDADAREARFVQVCTVRVVAARVGVVVGTPGLEEVQPVKTPLHRRSNGLPFYRPFSPKIKTPGVTGELEAGLAA
jgi:hypothetical protein